MHTSYVETRKEIEFFKEFIENVSQKTDGKLKLNLFAGGSLGVKDVDILRVLPTGNAIQIATIQPTWLSRDQASFAVVLPTGVLGDVADIRKIDEPLRKIFGETFDKWGVKLIGFVGQPASQGQLYCKTPVRTLEDLKKMKVRVWEKFQIDTFQKLGVSAQIIPQNELYLAMSTGVVDCTVYAAPWANSLSLHEVAPYGAYLFPLVPPPLNIVASKSAFASLPEDMQKAVIAAADETWAKTSELWISGALDEIEKKRFVEKGGQYLEPFSAEDQAAYAAAAREAWEVEAKAVGAEAVDGRQLLLDALAK
jgi:TRAP-type C4-dicarboxylate transport system substrate-binding protein